MVSMFQSGISDAQGVQMKVVVLMYHPMMYREKSFELSVFLLHHCRMVSIIRKVLL